MGNALEARHPHSLPSLPTRTWLSPSFDHSVASLHCKESRTAVFNFLVTDAVPIFLGRLANYSETNIKRKFSLRKVTGRNAKDLQSSDNYWPNEVTWSCFTAYGMTLGDSFAYVFMVLFFLKQNIPFLPQWKLKKNKKKKYKKNQPTSTVLDGHVFQNIHVSNKRGKKNKGTKVTQKIITIPRIILLLFWTESWKNLLVKAEFQGELQLAVIIDSQPKKIVNNELREV